MQIVNRRLRPSLRNYSVSAAVLITNMLICSCSKSNYLEAGKSARVIESQGMYLRATPNSTGRKIVLVPVGKAVNVLAEGLPEKLYDIKSKWYRVSYGKYEGWMWGGLAKHTSQANEYKPTEEDRQQYKQLAGDYHADPHHGLHINCDGTFDGGWSDGGDGEEIVGQITGSKFRVTKSIYSTTIGCGAGDGICKVERKVDLDIPEQSISEFMKYYQLVTKRNCK